jgi:hypothetical protein
VRQQVSIGAPANHFPTPSAADGLLLAPAADQVVAFSASGSGAASAPTPASQAATSPASGNATGNASSPSASAAPGGGGLPVGAFAGIVVAGLAVICGAGWLVWRRR